MADRYWRGGAGIWNTVNTLNWSATSGGAGGASVPTSADNVFLNAASGAVTVTQGASVTCKNFDTSGFTGTISAPGGYYISVFGNLAIGATGTLSSVAIIIRQPATTGSYTISCGKTLASFQMGDMISGYTHSLSSSLSAQYISIGGYNFNSNNFAITATVGSLGFGTTSGTTTLGTSALSAVTQLAFSVTGTITASGAISISSGRFDVIQGPKLTISGSGTISCTNSDIYSTIAGGDYNISRPISCSGIIRINRSVATPYSLSALSCPTFDFINTSTATMSISSVSCTNTATIDPGGIAFSSPLTMAGTASTLTAYGTISTVNVTAPSLTLNQTVGAITSLTSGASTTTISLQTNCTISNLTISGPSGTTTVQSSSAGTRRTLTVSSFSLSNITWKDINAAGTIPFTGTGFINGGNNANILFSSGNGLFFGSNF